uniref:Transmembrane protein 220 n=1 Tax=Lepisosteus oculatus TaxID=7918 RepID=W5N2P0_LEPOC
MRLYLQVAYSIPASLCFLISLKPPITEVLIWRRLSDLHMLICAAVAAMLGWSLYKSKAENIFQKEEGREFSGLLLIVVWLILCRHSGRNSVGALRVSTAVGITAFPLVTWLYYYINKELRSSWPSHCKTAL